jgi:hypothetical protein
VRRQLGETLAPDDGSEISIADGLVVCPDDARQGGDQRPAQCFGILGPCGANDEQCSARWAVAIPLEATINGGNRIGEVRPVVPLCRDNVASSRLEHLGDCCGCFVTRREAGPILFDCRNRHPIPIDGKKAVSLAGRIVMADDYRRDCVYPWMQVGCFPAVLTLNDRKTPLRLPGEDDGAKLAPAEFPQDLLDQLRLDFALVVVVDVDQAERHPFQRRPVTNVEVDLGHAPSLSAATGSSR